MYLLCIFLPLLGCLSILFGSSLGILGMPRIATFCTGLAALISLFIFYEVTMLNSSCIVEVMPWLFVGTFRVSWAFYFDMITSMMLCVVLIVSSLVHLYSTEYMSSDPHLVRFMSYLSFFTFFMLLLISGNNFIILFLGWEGVGLCSYLLISFWYNRIEANRAAIKAVIVNKVGDFALIIAISAIFFFFNSLDYSIVFPLVSFFSDNSFLKESDIFWLNPITFISLMLFIGAVGKSAQLGLHTWLPDAMEGPTPVSALIHAATMVTAGVFLIIRCSPIFEYSSAMLTIVTIVGALTAFFAATTGMLQNDLKKVIAYSTCSQLGYMVFACGLSLYNVSLFHLANHAFFKALLFLSAGSVIHAIMNEQDMRRMGGLINLIPFTYTMILVGSLALAGFPFLTGFYSKDLILEVAASSFGFSGLFAYWLGAVSAFFTAFYSFRLIYLTFYAKTNNFKGVLSKIHDSPINMAIPLIILGFGSIFIGYLTRDLVVGLGTNSLSNSIFINPGRLRFLESEFLPFSIKILPTIFSFMGMGLVLFLNFFFKNFLYRIKFTSIGYFFFFFFSRKWYFDSIINYFIVGNFLQFGYRTSFQLIDRGAIEFFFATGPALFFYNFSKIISKFQTGYIYNYLFFSLSLLFLFFSLTLFPSIFFFLDLRIFFLFFLFLVIYLSFSSRLDFKKMKRRLKKFRQSFKKDIIYENLDSRYPKGRGQSREFSFFGFRFRSNSFFNKLNNVFN